jgi:4,5-dihydroxyphthalate decarboxylase
MLAEQLELSIALSRNERTRPLIEGVVKPEGIRLVPTAVHPSEMFWRQLKYADFDVSEMSLSSLFIAHARGDRTWAALPVYTERRFFHTMILVRADSGIDKPADLKGKRVAVPEYQQTSVIWTRGILENEFGVKAQDVTWYMERGPDRSHGGATGFKPPAGVVLHQIPPTTDIGQMLVAGELDAALHYIVNNNLVDRSRIDLYTDARARLLFPDPSAEARRFYAATGIFPINHGVVVRRALLERYPWVALNLYNAFAAAKEESRQRLQASLLPYLATGLVTPSRKGALDADPLAYGVKATRHVLETIAGYLLEQGLAAERVNIDDVFWKSMLDL